MTLRARDSTLIERTDEELALACAAGEPDAFALLYARHRGRVHGYARRMLGRVEEADEVTAQAFLPLLEGRYTPVGRFRSYLFSVAHRACLDRLRRRRTVERYVPWLKVVKPQKSPEEMALIGSDKARMEQGLARLPERHREVLLLYYGQELTTREVAEILDCSEQQVRSRLAYARRLLRQAMEVGNVP